MSLLLYFKLVKDSLNLHIQAVNNSLCRTIFQYSPTASILTHQETFQKGYKVSKGITGNSICITCFNFLTIDQKIFVHIRYKLEQIQIRMSVSNTSTFSIVCTYLIQYICKNSTYIRCRPFLRKRLLYGEQHPLGQGLRRKFN